MRHRTTALLATSLAFACTTAWAQARGDEPLDAPDVAALAGPGPITASPTERRDDTRAAPMLPSRTSRLGRLLGNGTPLTYGQGGANAIGDTGGLTTGPRGNAGALSAGGGVHAGALAIPPGQANAAMREDAREQASATTQDARSTAPSAPAMP